MDIFRHCGLGALPFHVTAPRVVTVGFGHLRASSIDRTDHLRILNETLRAQVARWGHRYVERVPRDSQITGAPLTGVCSFYGGAEANFGLRRSS